MLAAMVPGESQAASLRRQLERTLASPGFSRNERLSRFLRFTVERHLEGRDDELKESVIAIEVFGKRDYDPQQDSLVRTEAGRLRARLAEYYLREGAADPVVIELPRGGYIPVFRWPDNAKRATPSRRARIWIAACLGLVAVAISGWQYWRHAAPIPIAVLPLNDLNQEPGNDYFADGLTDEIIRNLSTLDGLAVRSQTSSFAFKNKPRNVREAGEQLRADYLVEGSVLRAGQRLRINIRLIRVRDDMPVWSGQFDRQLIDVFAIHEEISRNIVNNLRLKLGRGRRRYETGTKAYEAYLHARAITVKWGPEDLSESVNLFQDVIAKDPSFVPAYAGLASTQAFLSARREDEPDREVQLAGMRAAAQKAIELDPLLAEAHDALGSAYAREGKWDLAEKSFRRAIQLDPSNGDTRSHFALFLLMPLGRIEEAVGQALVAERNDPLSPRVRLALANTLITARRYNEAAQNCLKLPREHPYAAECLGRARVGQGRLDEAIDILGAASNPGYLGYAYAKAGRRREAEKMAAETRPTRSFELALIFAGLGDTNRTLDALEGMSQTGPARVGRDLNYPQFTFLRGHPRLKAFRSRLGLPQ